MEGHRDPFVNAEMQWNDLYDRDNQSSKKRIISDVRAIRSFDAIQNEKVFVKMWSTVFIAAQRK